MKLYRQCEDCKGAGYRADLGESLCDSCEGAGMFEVDAIPIGWFDPGSKRFCYTDEKETWPELKKAYTQPVYRIEGDG